jgi:hypothetical protein
VHVTYNKCRCRGNTVAMGLRVEPGQWEQRTDADDGVWEQRVDRGVVLSSVQREDGTLLVEGVAARAGIYPYLRADGTTRRELVTDEMLQRTAKGLGRAGVTLHHPDPKRHPQGVTPKNAKELLVGDTDGNVRVEEGGFVRVWLAVRHQDALDAIAAGTQELSPGYAVQLGPGGTHPKYGAYDAEQIDRRYNHLALVDAARGGAEVRLHLDDATAICTETITGATPNAGSPAPTPNPTHHDGGSVRIVLLEIARHLGLGDQRFDTDESLAKAISVAVQARNDADEAAEATLAQLQADAEAHAATLKAEKERGDREKARADAAELAATNLREADKARADKAEREEIEGLAKELHLDAAGFPLLKDLRRAIASAQKGEQIKADASDDYVQAYLDEARKASKVRADGRDAGKNAWAPPAMRGQAGPGNRRNDTNGPATGSYTPPPAPSGRPSGFSRVRARQDSLRGDGQRNGGEG